MDQPILISAIVALAGVVSFLFGILRKEMADVKKRLVECEDDRRALWERVAMLQPKE